MNTTEPKYPEASRRSISKVTISDHTTYKDQDGNIISKEEYNEVLKKKNERIIFKLKPIDRTVIYEDGYAGKDTLKNLSEMAELARKHPDKIFIAAGGNPTDLGGETIIPDVREARLKLESWGLWPSNLIIVGFVTNIYGFNLLASYGADIYVSSIDLKNLDIQSASSFATPFITEIVRSIIKKGAKNLEQTKEQLMSLTIPSEMWRGSEVIKYQLLDLEKVVKSLSNQ